MYYYNLNALNLFVKAVPLINRENNNRRFRQHFVGIVYFKQLESNDIFWNYLRQKTRHNKLFPNRSIFQITRAVKGQDLCVCKNPWKNVYI